MVIPWDGFPLAKLVALADPKAEAKYLKFTSFKDPEHAVDQRDAILDWPYVEGLRLDEATNELAFIATGIYGKPLLNQNGAPLRLVVPWKYGFKGIKSIVKIEFTNTQPLNTWNIMAPNEMDSPPTSIRRSIIPAGRRRGSASSAGVFSRESRKR